MGRNIKGNSADDKDDSGLTANVTAPSSCLKVADILWNVGKIVASVP